jgi:hypothetical protein
MNFLNKARIILLLNLLVIGVIIVCHALIILAHGKNNIIIDVLLFSMLPVLFGINIYSLVIIIKRKIRWEIIVALVLSAIYYTFAFFIPLFSGSR